MAHHITERAFPVGSSYHPACRRQGTQETHHLYAQIKRAESVRYNDLEYIEERRRWAEAVLQGPGNMNAFVYLDEAGFNLHIIRNFGRASRGRRAIQKVLYNRGPNYSLIVALDMTGILAIHFRQGAFNQEALTRLATLFPEIEDDAAPLSWTTCRFTRRIW